MSKTVIPSEIFSFSPRIGLHLLFILSFLTRVLQISDFIPSRLVNLTFYTISGAVLSKILNPFFPRILKGISIHI